MAEKKYYSKSSNIADKVLKAERFFIDSLNDFD